MIPRLSRSTLRAAAVALPACALTTGLLGWTIWLLWEPIREGGLTILGRNPDALDAAWGLALSAQSDRPGPWTSWVGPPDGLLGLYSPVFTGRLLAPLQILNDPGSIYALGTALILAADAAAVALLAREVCGRWGPAALAGATFVAQPAVTRLAIEGSLEHVTLWPLPTCLAAALASLRTGDLRFAALSGLFASLIPLDSPYGVAYGALLAPLALIGPLLLRWRRGGRDWTRATRALGTAFAAALPILLLSAMAFAAADLERIEGRAGDMDRLNAVTLRGWALFEAEGWDAGVRRGASPAVDVASLIGGGILALIGGRQALPWLAAAGIALVLCLGVDPDNAEWAGARWGSTAAAVAAALTDLNRALSGVFPFSFVRFPWRWAPVGALALSVAASIGAARVVRWVTSGLPRRASSPEASESTSAPPPSTGQSAPWREARAALAGLCVGLPLATALITADGYRDALPGVEGPDVAACRWLRAQPGPGAVLLIPTFRQPVDDGFGVFARLGEVLTSRDRAWLQLLHGRPQNTWIDTVPTLIPLGDGLDGEAGALVKALDRRADAALNPGVTPPSPPSGIADAGVDGLLDAGYRFLMLDEAAFDADALAWVAEVLGARVLRLERFEDGRGIAVIELR